MATAHNRIHFKGTLVTSEVWSCRVCFGAADPGGLVTTYDGLAAWAKNIANLNSGTVFTTALRSALSAQGRLTGIRAEYYDDSGQLADVAERAPVGSQVGSGDPKCPPQCSLVVSLRTGRPGRSYRGRIYLPALGISLTSTGARIAPNYAASVVNETAALLQDVQNAVPEGGDVELAVYSGTYSRLSAVTSLEVGTVVDTQRRRRDKLQEEWSSATFPPV